ncbi:MAG: carotenoid biosynthesis protein [Bacteroidota bacterium]|nr:carotenoid biosynthesis protein [Bacteroidota bacterium]
MGSIAVKNRIRYKTTIGIFLLVLFHLVGFIGLTNDYYSDFFISLTPFHLLFSSIILFAFHKDWSSSFYFFFILTFLVGYFVEVIGIQTGVIFGQYKYGSVLGPKIFETPLIIGVNWLMLLYCTGMICKSVSKNLYINTICATLLMVLLDIFIEPVAITLGFWEWSNPVVPLQNYIAWGLISFALLYIFYYLPFQKINALALCFYLVQLSFFISLNLFYNIEHYIQY